MNKELELYRGNPVQRFALKNTVSLLIAVNHSVLLTFLALGFFLKEGVYQFAVIGVFYEHLWLPILAMLFCSPLVLGYWIYQNQFRFNSSWLLFALSVMCIVLLFTTA